MTTETGTLSCSAEIDKIAPALVKALPELGNLAKDKEGKIQLQGGGGYSFKYADLKQLLDMSKPILQQHDIVVMQTTAPASSGARVFTVLLHSSGQWIRDDGLMIPAAKANDPKAFGSAVSYARRYALSAMLGIAQADDDGDAAGKVEKPAAKAAEKSTTKLAPKKQRDALQARIEALPAEYSGQIGQRLRTQKVVWQRLDVDTAKLVEQWVVDCEELAATQGD